MCDLLVYSSLFVNTLVFSSQTQTIFHLVVLVLTTIAIT